MIRRLLLRRGLSKRWPLVLPIALGAGFLALAATNVAPTITLLRTATRADGTFVGAVSRTGLYRPMFRYNSNDGSIRTFTAQGGRLSPTYKSGDHAPVLYDPDNPEIVRLATFSELWLPALGVGVPGLLLLLLGTLMLAAYRRRDREVAAN